MNDNPFLDKLSNKSSSELNSIAEGKHHYRLEARVAAVYILKERGERSEFEKSVLSELRAKQDEANRNKIAEENITLSIIKRLSYIPRGRDSVWGISRWRELRIRKIGKNLFRARIEDHYRSFMAPVVICQIRTDGTLKFIPFFHLKPILFASIFSVLIFGIHFTGIVQLDDYLFTSLFPVVITVGLQLFLLPLFFFMIRNAIIEKLGRKY